MLIPEEQILDHACVLIHHRTATEAQLPFSFWSLAKGCGVWVDWGKEARDLGRKHLVPAAAAAAAAAANSVL